MCVGGSGDGPRCRHILHLSWGSDLAEAIVSLLACSLVHYQVLKRVRERDGVRKEEEKWRGSD